MRATGRTLRLAGGIGSLLACGASGLVVAVDAKQSAAPLHPPVEPSAPLTAAVATRGGGPQAVDIPATPVCQGSAVSRARLDAAAHQALTRLRCRGASDQQASSSNAAIAPDVADAPAATQPVAVSAVS